MCRRLPHVRFTVDGTGTKLNFSGRRDVKADIDIVRCSEHDGAVWVEV